MCVENSASVAFVARWSTITGLRASGAMVATYWSVSVTVRMAQTEITEMGIKSDASTMSTQVMIRRVRAARGSFSPASPAARTRPRPSRPTASSESILFICACGRPDA